MNRILRNTRNALRILLMTGVVLSAMGLHAEDGADPSSEKSVRTARLASVDGSTQIFGAGETADQAGPVQANMPLLEGTQLRTGEDGRAEVQFEDGGIVRLTPNSQLFLVKLGGKETEIEVTQGLAYFELPGESARPFAVRYSDSVVKLVTDAAFRVNLDNQPGELAVFSGEVVVANGEQKIIVRENEALHFDTDGSGRYFLSGEIVPDSWDQWNEGQDAAAPGNSEQTDVAGKYSNGATYGWQDLDADGQWYPMSDGAPVWQPNDAGDDFNPYGSGDWGYYPGVGYTWISGYPWGWTPFRCGSWSFFDGFGWGWRPGGCFGLGGIRFRRPPRNWRPPVKPIGVPPVVRVKHPVLPHTPPHKVAMGEPLTPAQPVHKTGPVMLNGELVSPIPKKPVTRTSVGEGDVETILGNRRGVERPDYPAGQGMRYMGGSGRENPLGPPARMNPPVVARPLPPVTVRPMPAPPVQVHSAPPPPAPVHMVPAH
jgi:FecR protein